MLTHDMPFLKDAYDRASFLGRIANIHSADSREYHLIETMHDLTATLFSQEERMPGVKYVDYVRMMALIAIERTLVSDPASINFIIGRYNRDVANKHDTGAWDTAFVTRHFGEDVETGMATLSMPWMPAGLMTDSDLREYDARFYALQPCDLVSAHLADGLTELLHIDAAATGTERLRIYHRGRDHYLDLAGKSRLLWREIQHACNGAAAMLAPIE